MDRLRKEWRETRISREMALRARNQAWEKIHRPVIGKRIGGAAFAVCIIALAVFFVRFRSGPGGTEERTAPVPSNVATIADIAPVVPPANIQSVEQSAPEIAAVKDSAPPKRPKRETEIAGATALDRPLPGQTTKRAGDRGERAIDAAVAPTIEEVSLKANEVNEANGEPNRVVLNFILPESGARLIWIVNSNL